MTTTTTSTPTASPACPSCGNRMFNCGLPWEPYWCGACGMRVRRDEAASGVASATAIVAGDDLHRVTGGPSCLSVHS